MPSDVAIFNRALSWLGDKTITSFAQDTNLSRTAVSLYEQCRDGLVADYPWTFAMTRATLPVLAEVPAFQYKYAYQLPAECFRLWEVAGGWAQQDLYTMGWGGDTIPGGVPAGFNPYRVVDYAIEGRKLLTNIAPPLPVRFVQLITDPTIFPPPFVDTFATRLAIEACVRVTGSDALKPGLMSQHDRYIARAKKADAIAKPPRMMQDGDWISSQFRG